MKEGRFESSLLVEVSSEGGCSAWIILSSVGSCGLEDRGKGAMLDGSCGEVDAGIIEAEVMESCIVKERCGT